MAEDDLRLRKAIEHAVEDEAQRVRACLKPPFPHGALQAVGADEDRIRRDWIGGVKIDRSSECFDAFPERIERGVVEILAIGVAVDHATAETELAHAALQLFSGVERILQGKMRKPRIA